MSHPGETALALNEKRRRAVEMRLAGASLAEVRAATGLSAPTVIGAYKAFRAGGWQAVPVKGLGRHVGQGRRLTAEQEGALRRALATESPPAPGLWTIEAARAWVASRFGLTLSESTLQRLLAGWGLDLLPLRDAAPPADAAAAQWLAQDLPRHLGRARARRARVVWVDQLAVGDPSARLLCAASLRGQPAWLPMAAPNQATAYRELLERLLAQAPSPLAVLLHGIDAQRDAGLSAWISAQGARLQVVACPIGLRRRAPAAARAEVRPAAAPEAPRTTVLSHRTNMTMNLTHLQRLEAEAIHIMREVVAETENPVMLYSIGKDSACMLRLAQKAFFPSVPPFPLLHVDTTWKFRDMYALRDRVTELTGMKLLVYQNPEAQALGINPFDHGSQIHTDLWKTQGLKKALDHYGFDAAFGGARRDEGIGPAVRIRGSPAWSVNWPRTPPVRSGPGVDPDGAGRRSPRSWPWASPDGGCPAPRNSRHGASTPVANWPWASRSPPAPHRARASPPKPWAHCACLPTPPSRCSFPGPAANGCPLGRERCTP